LNRGHTHDLYALGFYTPLKDIRRALRENLEARPYLK
jgi:hypothetical protein